MNYLLLEVDDSGTNELLEPLEVVHEGLRALLAQWDDIHEDRRQLLLARLESRMAELEELAQRIAAPDAKNVVDLRSDALRSYPRRPMRLIT